MLPGVAQAGPDPLKEGPLFYVSIGCDLEGGGTVLFSTVGPAGWAQSSVRWIFNNDPDTDDCIPNTKTTTITQM